MENSQLKPLFSPDPGSLTEELERVWASGGAALLLDSEMPVPRAPMAPDTVLVLATSGSTGAPRLVELSDSALDAAVKLTNDAVGAVEGDRWLCCLPVTHVGGLMTLLRSRSLGTRAVVHRRFDVDRIRAERSARFVSLVPAMLHRLLEAGVDLSGFARVLIGGASADHDLIERARVLGVAVTTTYGMTETCGGVVYDGVPLDGVDVRIEDGGRIALASPTLMSGYLGDRVLTDSVLADGWFLTSDRGSLEDGRLRVTGRLDATIITAGNNVDPGEVENALRDHPNVADVAVRGEADEERGQRVVALVVPAGEAPALEDLHAFLEGRLSRYKWPRSVRVVDRLPKGYM